MFRTLMPATLKRARGRRVSGFFLLLAVVVSAFSAFPAVTHASALGELLSGAWSLMSSPVSWVVGQALSAVASIIKYLASWILWAGGGIMEASIQYTLQAGFYKLEGVREGWTIIRDVANMVFIFVLVYIGFVTILQLAGFNTKQTLVWLIIMALLVNFSFFLTGVVIDAANVLGWFFYNAVTLGGSESISEQIANGLDLETIFDSSAYGNLDGLQAAVADFLGSALMALAGLAFLAVGILFIFRTIALTFVLVLSPLAFVAAILPKTRQHFNQWLSALVNHAFVAPIFLLIATIIVRILNEGNLISNAQSYGEVIAADRGDPNVATLEILVVYGIIIGLLFGAIAIARKMSGAAGKYSAKYAGTAAGMALGAGAFAARRTVGRGAYELTQNERFKRWAAENAAAGAAYKGAEKASSATMDLRNTQVTKGLENVAKSSGAVEGGFGKAGGKGGYAAQRKQEKEQRTKLAQSVGKTGYDKSPEAQERAKARKETATQRFERRSTIRKDDGALARGYKGSRSITGTRQADREAVNELRKKETPYDKIKEALKSDDEFTGSLKPETGSESGTESESS